MARTRRSEILGRYRQEERQAKEAYKAERGLKIAKGFKDTTEAKRIDRNRGQALGRYQFKKSAETAEKFTGKVKAERDRAAQAKADTFKTGQAQPAPTEPLRAAGNFEVLADSEPFWAVMRGPTGETAEAADQYSLQAENSKSKNFVGTIADGGKIEVFKTRASFERAMEEKYKGLAAEQRALAIAISQISKAAKDGKQAPAAALAAVDGAGGAIGSAGRLCSLSVGEAGETEVLALTIH